MTLVSLVESLPAPQVDRFTKTKKSIYTSFELFSLKVPSVQDAAQLFRPIDLHSLCGSNVVWPCVSWQTEAGCNPHPPLQRPVSRKIRR